MRNKIDKNKRERNEVNKKKKVFPSKEWEKAKTQKREENSRSRIGRK